MEDSKRFYELMALKHEGKLTLQERVEFNRILESDSELAAIYGYISEIYDSSFITCSEINDEFIGEKWASLHQKISKPRSGKNNTTKKIVYWFAAASVLIALVASYIHSNTNQPEIIPPKDNIVSTRKGSKTKLLLPDGTQVWLNADSKISYNEQFGRNLREVKLDGEAYFEVAKNPQKPFVVHTPSMDVKVLGTVFNVKAYPSDKAAETSLIEGSVEVSLKKSGKKILLKPLEKLLVSNQYLNKEPGEKVPASATAPDITISQMNTLPDNITTVETQWTQNKLAFYNQKLGDVVTDLSRWYGVKIVVADEKLMEKRFSGNFEDESAEEVLDALKLTGEFQYKIENKQITIIP